MNKLNINTCLLCGETNLKHLMDCIDSYASGKKFELCFCENCGFTFTQNFPSDNDIEKYYNSSEYISHTDSKKGLINTIYHHARKFMLSRKAKLVMRESHRNTGKLLDIGTGTGYFAKTMEQKGWLVDAIEKNNVARGFAKERFELNVYDEQTLFTLPEKRYHVITLWHVLEHLENLNQIWSRLYELLADKGILIIAVPNMQSYDAEKYGNEWAAYDVPRHLWHFTPATIQRFGNKHGFIMAAHYPMPLDAFYVSMLSEKNRKKYFPFIRGLWTGTLAWFNTLLKKDCSSSIIYIFRKKQNDKEK